MSTEEKTITSRVEDALEAIRPFLQADGGDVELVEVTSDNKVSIRLLGSCQHCQISDMTMKFGIEEGIKRDVPEVKSITAINKDEEQANSNS